MSSISPNTPKRGEIWLVDFNPTRGAEIQKQRPALVVNSDAIGRLPIKLVAPITGWKPAFAGNLWHVRVIPDRLNGVVQVRFLSRLQRIGLHLRKTYVSGPSGDTEHVPIFLMTRWQENHALLACFKKHRR